MTNYWLMKSELDVYPWEKLVEDGQTHWDGVRNYQARNLMRDEMKKGDLVLFYHSNCKPPHIAGIARIIRESYPDFTSWDVKSKYFDPKSKPENPRWDCVKVKYISKSNNILSLPELKNLFNEDELLVVKKGNRLSIVPIKSEVAKILLEKI